MSLDVICRTLSSLGLFAPLVLMVADSARSGETDTTVYELRTYTTHPGKLDDLHARFRDHTVELFNKHGMKSIAYWTPASGPQSENTLIYIIQHKSRQAAKDSWKNFVADPIWKKVYKESHSDGPILAKRPESTYMQATDYSPKVQGRVQKKGQDKRVYELRIYTAAEGKLDDLNARFRDHTDKIFNSHGMKSIGYFVPTDEPPSGNTLIYVLEHDSPEAAKKSWQGFREDPAWQSARKKSEEDGRLLVKGGVQSTHMKATDYSPRR